MEDAESQFLEILEEEQKTLDGLAPREAFGLMIDFFANWGALEVDVDKDGDGLLFQWGTYDWSNTGSPKFDLNLTRQLIVSTRDDDDDLDIDDDERTDLDERGDDGTYQLSLTFQFEADDATEALGHGTEWFFAPAIDSNAEDGVLSSDVLAEAEKLPVLGVNLEFFAV